jgi:hypothetical protein
VSVADLTKQVAVLDERLEGHILGEDARLAAIEQGQADTKEEVKTVGRRQWLLLTGVAGILATVAVQVVLMNGG